MPLDHNDNITEFPPKGEDPGDDTDLIRNPQETRPITLNADNKIICPLVNSRIKSHVNECAC